MAPLKWASAETSHLSHSSICCSSWRTLNSPLPTYSSVVRKGFRWNLHTDLGFSSWLFPLYGISLFTLLHPVKFQLVYYLESALRWKVSVVLCFHGSASSSFCLLRPLSSYSNTLSSICNFYLHECWSYISHSTIIGIRVCEKVLIMVT